MLCTCRRCGNERQWYVRQLCKLCYQVLKKQEVRDSPLFDRNMLYPRGCGVRYCKAYSTSRFGIPMCNDHHEKFYHTSGYFESYNCPCPLRLNPAEVNDGKSNLDI